MVDASGGHLNCHLGQRQKVAASMTSAADATDDEKHLVLKDD
jgi:hypothetical protein